MLRFAFRLIVLALVVGAGAYALGYRWDAPAASRARAVGDEARAAAGALAERVDGERIREAGAEIAETIAGGADRAGAALGEARLTAKIKSKIALDDTLDGARLDLETEGTVVTIRGSVETPAQRERALQLARETEGVTSVVDRLTVNGR